MRWWRQRRSRLLWARESSGWGLAGKRLHPRPRRNRVLGRSNCRRRYRRNQCGRRLRCRRPAGRRRLLEPTSTCPWRLRCRRRRCLHSPIGQRLRFLSRSGSHLHAHQLGCRHRSPGLGRPIASAHSGRHRRPVRATSWCWGRGQSNRRRPCLRSQAGRRLRCPQHPGTGQRPFPRRCRRSRHRPCPTTALGRWGRRLGGCTIRRRPGPGIRSGRSATTYLLGLDKRLGAPRRFGIRRATKDFGRSRYRWRNCRRSRRHRSPTIGLHHR